jgi:hypothetical protein
VMGGTMYCLQAGHCSSIRTLLPMSEASDCMLGIPRLSCVRIKKGDICLKHNSLITTIPWLPFASTQHRFSLQASTSGLCLPQPVSLHRPAPSTSSLLSIGAGYFWDKTFSYKYPNNPILLTTRTPQ